MGAVSNKVMTVAEFAEIPNPPGGRYELHRGVLVEMPPPTLLHKKIERRIRQLLEPHAAGIGVVETEVGYFPLPEHEAWTADVAFVSQARWDNGDPKGLRGSPELVIEIESPSNTKPKLALQQKTCFAGGCKEFWVVDTRHRAITVCQPDGISRSYQAIEMMPVALFPSLSLKVAAIFAV